MFFCRRLLTFLLGYLVAQAKTYPMQTWPMYPQSPREYTDDEYYYTPKVQYYYEAPAMSLPDMHEQVQYPYYYDPYGHFVPNEIPKEQEERLAALPIGQETWFESDPPRWRTNEVDDVSAAFLDNLILTQMAQDAQRRRENARAAFPPVDYEEPRDVEDEDVKELKALAGKPIYHVPQTVPKVYEDDDYVADDGFINWNGNKRSVTTVAPSTSTQQTLTEGQKEVMVPRPAQTRSHLNKNKPFKRTNFYETIAQLLANKSTKTQSQVSFFVPYKTV